LIDCPLLQLITKALCVQVRVYPIYVENGAYFLGF